MSFDRVDEVKGLRDMCDSLLVRAEAAEAEVGLLREALVRGIAIASQYLDTDRGDLDGWVEDARAALAKEKEQP